MLNIEDIKNGDTFFECEYGANDEYVACSDPFKKQVGTEYEGWAIFGTRVEGGDKIEFFAASKFSYGPKLYSYPAYF
jgi:hypothetical protein